MSSSKTFHEEGLRLATDFHVGDHESGRACCRGWRFAICFLVMYQN